ncbi:MAG: nicotinate (nicotinamide) nucleotide adenylyltransferase [Treponema sp.]|nr:nicotinate (nicotinamide) nucleotide adenylyltransferase [Treponema sp.]
MRLAILGGSFNPIHLGHLFLADAVLSELHYDRVVMVPAYISPFKPAAVGMEDSAQQRLEMIAASIAANPRLSVDACEIRREGVSYTVDTVADIINRYNPDGKPGLIIGDDLIGDFPKWYKSDEILSLTDIIIARRVHSSCPEIPFPNTQITNDIMEISSGAVREKIASNSAWRYLVPDAARIIIEDRELYGFHASTDNTPPRVAAIKSLIQRIENEARANLNPARYFHSRHTALLAWDLCRRFRKDYPSLDPDLGYLVGIAHDLCKQTSDDEQIRLAKIYGGEISRIEKDKPSLLHGKACAVVLKDRFKVNDNEVLEAVAHHTEGHKDMGPLAKVVYIADKMEVSRVKVDPALRKRILSGDTLDRILISVLEQAVSSLRNRKLELSKETLGLLEKMGLLYLLKENGGGCNAGK